MPPESQNPNGASDSSRRLTAARMRSNTSSARASVVACASGWIAREKKFSVARIPDCKREHAAQPRQHRLAQILEEMQQHLRIALRFEGVAAAEQFCAQLAVIVDLAVEDQAQTAVFVGHGLF